MEAGVYTVKGRGCGERERERRGREVGGRELRGFWEQEEAKERNMRSKSSVLPD